MFILWEVGCFVVGDGESGKTKVLMSYTRNKYPDDYIATVFDDYESLRVVDGKTVRVNLDDIAYQEEYEEYTVSRFGDADVFLVCFSIGSHASLSNADKKVWIIINFFYIYFKISEN